MCAAYARNNDVCKLNHGASCRPVDLSAQSRSGVARCSAGQSVPGTAQYPRRMPSALAGAPRYVNFAMTNERRRPPSHRLRRRGAGCRRRSAGRARESHATGPGRPRLGRRFYGPRNPRTADRTGRRDDGRTLLDRPAGRRSVRRSVAVRPAG